MTKRAPHQAMSEQGRLIFEMIRSAKGNHKIIKTLLKRERSKRTPLPPVRAR